jgi:hypothetical protein
VEEKEVEDQVQAAEEEATQSSSLSSAVASTKPTAAGTLLWVRTEVAPEL